MAHLVRGSRAMPESRTSVCARFRATPLVAHPRDKVGVARNLTGGMLPWNGLRLAPEAGTCGWYLWAGGEMSEDPDFFGPIHVEHLADLRPEVLPYLDLPPGWRF